MATNQPVYDFTGRQDPGKNRRLLQLLMAQHQAEAIPASTRRDPVARMPGWLEEWQQRYPYQPGRPEMGFDPEAAQANILPGLIERGMDVKGMVEAPVETGVGLAELAKGALQVAGAAPAIAMGGRSTQEAARRRLSDNPVALMLQGGIRELRDLVGEKGVMGALASMGNRPVDVAEMMLGVVPGGAVPKAAKAAKAAVTPPIPRLQAGTRISTRYPTASKAVNPNIEDGIKDNTLRIDMKTMEKDPRLMEVHAQHIQQYPNYMPGVDQTPQGVIATMQQQVIDNLLWLHDQVPEGIRKRSKLWYDGANRIAGEFGQQFGVTREAAAAVIASQSPQRDWFQNVRLAELILDVHQNRGAHVWDGAMSATAARIYKKNDFKEGLARIVGRRYDELEHSVDKAMWLRAYSETHHANEFHIIAPEGDRMGLKVNVSDGQPSKIGWGSLDEIAKAVRVLDDPTPARIAEEMGDAHKVRSFYNNIIDPNSAHGDVTMDTHAIAAALLRPLSGKATEVDHNLGAGGSNSLLGIKGSYAIYADAYREAARQRGLLPREMQSITWEAIRGLFSDEFKRTPAAAHSGILAAQIKAGLAGKPDAIDKRTGLPKMTPEKALELLSGSLEAEWYRYKQGLVPLDDLRQITVERAGGFSHPDWVTPADLGVFPPDPREGTGLLRRAGQQRVRQRRVIGGQRRR